MLEHAIADMHQLAHHRADHHLLRFAPRRQSLGVGLERWTEAHRRDRRPGPATLCPTAITVTGFNCTYLRDECSEIAPYTILVGATFTATDPLVTSKSISRTKSGSCTFFTKNQESHRRATATITSNGQIYQGTGDAELASTLTMVRTSCH